MEHHISDTPWSNEAYIRSKFETMGFAGKTFAKSLAIKDADRRVIDVTTPATDIPLQYSHRTLLQNQSTLANGGSIDVLDAVFTENPGDAYLNPGRLALKLPSGLVRTENMHKYESELSTVQAQDISKTNTREK